ncbi:selenoprotein M-like [Phymastichus coffea]|uniref:selenoprotein M-like n=1 Tax=Phymastichus coffea TaxID=108790 RepID=UPI00273A9C80|nr:selenoprotein M-like [Phymastichus coffea]
MRFAMRLAVLAILLGCSVTFASEVKYSRAVVESCKGCQLNQLPEIRKFIFEDLPHYENVEYKHIQGEPPELVLYDRYDEEVERLKLAKLTRDECNELLVSKGFKRSSSAAKDEM